MKLSRHIIFATLLTAAVPAQAQYYTQSTGYAPQPLYPYAVPGQAYGYTYPAAPQYAPAYPYVRPTAKRARASAKIMDVERSDRQNSDDAAPASRRKTAKVDPALIEELRARGNKSKAKDTYVDGKKIDKVITVRGKPRVVTSQRIVDDPPIVVTRNHVVDVPEEAPAGRGLIRSGRSNRAKAQAEEVTPRVIRAEAEVQILGPDRMSIRLFRRGTQAPVDLAND